MSVEYLIHQCRFSGSSGARLSQPSFRNRTVDERVETSGRINRAVFTRSSTVSFHTLTDLCLKDKELNGNRQWSLSKPEGKDAGTHEERKQKIQGAKNQTSQPFFCVCSDQSCFLHIRFIPFGFYRLGCRSCPQKFITEILTVLKLRSVCAWRNTDWAGRHASCVLGKCEGKKKKY